MSEQAGEAIELPAHGDAAFGALMDALAPEPEGAPAAAPAGGGGTAADAPAVPGADTGGGGDGAAGRPTAGAGEPGGAAPGGAAGQAPGDAAAVAGDPVQPAADGAGSDRPAAWTAAAADLVPKLGELSTALEENTSKAYQAQAYEAVRGEHGQYFAALEKHPYTLVGTDVPAIGKEGMQTLQSTQDARDWQEAVKSLLVEEIRDRAGRQLEESRDFLATVHGSIELFQNNHDLVPGTKDFDVELANEFVKLATPYEVRVDGKLQGYSIPVQPIIESLRSQLAARRTAAAPTAPAATPAVGAPAPAGGTAATPPAADPPQAGIPSKAGNSDSREDFSTLFGTIGLPNLQI